MNPKATDPGALCRKKQGGCVFLQLDDGCGWVSSKCLRRGIALALWRAFNTDRRGTVGKRPSASRLRSVIVTSRPMNLGEIARDDCAFALFSSGDRRLLVYRCITRMTKKLWSVYDIVKLVEAREAKKAGSDSS